ncbi:MAG: glycosyltransferase family 39 protein, partial [Candidatus Zixiibacteriota bacterium]
MLKHLKFKQILYVLIAVCLIVRFTFILAVQQLPVMWDARIYSSAAIGLIHYLNKPDRFGHPENDTSADSTFFRAQFEYEMKNLIQGEQINWLYYTVPTSTEAQDFLFLSGPIYPIYLAVLFYVCPAGDFILVRILNVLIETLCLLLLVLIARRLFGERAAFLAGLLYIFYLPFILLAGMVSPEPMTILMILLTSFLILQWYDRQNAGYIYFIGAILGILALLKPTAVMLFIP